MAKTPKTVSDEDLAAEFERLFGGNDEQSTVKQWLDTGYAPLNHALSSRYDGGMPVGRMVEMFGPPSSGKTAIATGVMASAQKMGGIAGFSDHEHSFSMALAPNLGLNIKPGRFIYKKPRTFEDSLTLCIKTVEYVRTKELIPASAPIAWVFDCLAAMVPQSKLFDAKTGARRDADSYNMHDNTALARATSAAFPAFAQMIEELDVLAVFLNQQRTKPGVMYGDPTTTPGGDAPKFYASTRIQLGAQRITKGQGADAQVLGSLIGAKVVKNKCARPFLKASWRFLYQPDGSGKFDTVGSMIDFLVANKLIEEPTKGRVTWDGKALFKSQVAEIVEREGRLPELLALLPKTAEPVVEIPEGAEGAWDDSDAPADAA